MQEVNGYLWHFKYPLISDQGQILDEYLEVATTRPETLLGDTALAVNPNDERYKKYIDKKVKVPFVDREIPIISPVLKRLLKTTNFANQPPSGGIPANEKKKTVVKTPAKGECFATPPQS